MWNSCLPSNNCAIPLEAHAIRSENRQWQVWLVTFSNISLKLKLNFYQLSQNLITLHTDECHTGCATWCLVCTDTLSSQGTCLPARSLSHLPQGVILISQTDRGDWIACIIVSNTHTYHINLILPSSLHQWCSYDFGSIKVPYYLYSFLCTCFTFLIFKELITWKDLLVHNEGVEHIVFHKPFSHWDDNGHWFSSPRVIHEGTYKINKSKCNFIASTSLLN